MGDNYEKIDIDDVSEHFEACLRGDHAVSIKLGEYILAYREINKFFAHLGSIFTFVKDDVDSKCSVLESHCRGPKGAFYESVSGMVHFEISSGLIDAKYIKHCGLIPTEKKITSDSSSKVVQDSFEETRSNFADGNLENEQQSGDASYSNLPSGSRSLLRLHRATKFVTELFLAVLHSDPSDGSSIRRCIKKLYDQTLASFHPWIARKAVHLALLTACPSRQKLLTLVSYDGTTSDLERKCQRLASVGRKVAENTQKIYEENGICDLP